MLRFLLYLLLVISGLSQVISRSTKNKEMMVVLAGDGVTYDADNMYLHFSMDDNKNRRWIKFFKILFKRLDNIFECRLLIRLSILIFIFL